MFTEIPIPTGNLNLQTIANGNPALLKTTGNLNPQTIANGNPALLKTTGNLNPQMIASGSLALPMMTGKRTDVSTSDTKRTVSAASNGAKTCASRLVVSGLLRKKIMEAPERSPVITIQTALMTAL